MRAEFVKSRLSKGYSSIEALRDSFKTNPEDEKVAKSQSIDGIEPANPSFYPRWVRINTLKTNTADQLRTTFANYKPLDSLEDLAKSVASDVLYLDEHIPDLIALSPSTDLTRAAAYKYGDIILQDKASCFPAYLLDPQLSAGNVMDACAAPGNKTTHLSALLHGAKISDDPIMIYACERDKARAATLSRMVEVAGAAANVKVYHGLDFLKVNADKPPWNTVSTLLLDPSCSGSGIIGRDEAFRFILPKRNSQEVIPNAKKRKRESAKPSLVSNKAVPEEPPPLNVPDEDLSSRLDALSAFQLKLLIHAFSFPEASKITYSTCSVYEQENEQVVMKALLSSVANARGWRILRREEQVSGLRRWHIRGQWISRTDRDGLGCNLDTGAISEACIRCEKGTMDGTQGFFVAAFVRDGSPQESAEEEWEGFSDPS